MHQLKKLSIFILLLCFNVSIFALSYDEAYTTSYKAWRYAYTYGYTKSSTYIYVDFTKPSTEKRLYVISNNTIVYSTYVAHGINSGSGLYAQTFSNAEGSNKSSLGVSKVTEYYQGSHDTAARLIGLDIGFNDNILKRHVVIHSAKYIGNGKSGHSLGCLAVPYDAIKIILSYAKPGTIIISYYPDKSWLTTSKFLKE